MNLPIAVVHLLDFDHNTVTDLSHVVAGCLDLLKRHFFRLDNRLAEPVFARCLVGQDACVAVGMALRLLVQDVIVLHHIFLSALPYEVLVG